MTTPDMKQGFCQENQKEDPEKLMEFRDKGGKRNTQACLTEILTVVSPDYFVSATKTIRNSFDEEQKDVENLLILFVTVCEKPTESFALVSSS